MMRFAFLLTLIFATDLVAFNLLNAELYYPDRIGIKVSYKEDPHILEVYRGYFKNTSVGFSSEWFIYRKSVGFKITTKLNQDRYFWDYYDFFSGLTTNHEDNFYYVSLPISVNFQDKQDRFLSATISMGVEPRFRNYGKHYADGAKKYEGRIYTETIDVVPFLECTIGVGQSFSIGATARISRHLVEYFNEFDDPKMSWGLSLAYARNT